MKVRDGLCQSAESDENLYLLIFAWTNECDVRTGSGSTGFPVPVRPTLMPPTLTPDCWRGHYSALMYKTKYTRQC